MKQTAVEWLAEQMLHPDNHNPYIEKALEMEKEQIIDAHTIGYIIGGGNGDIYDCKEYYKETYEE